MNFCVNCKHYSVWEGQRETIHNCVREASKNFNLVTGRQLPGFMRNAETERAITPSTHVTSVCGPEGIYFERKL